MLRKALETVLHKYLSDELAARIIKEVIWELSDELRKQKGEADGESTTTGSR